MFMLKLVWMHLVALRFMLCLMPQTGYIFPDEFFQSSEVMAGDILGLSSHLTWEWTSENPIRSILYPFLSSGIPFKLFMWWKEFFDGEQLVTPFIILVLPRCWMTIQSLLIDFFIYKIATQAFRDSLNGWLAMTLFASSYTTWVFCTRTFSNATETLCLAALLYLALPTKLKDEADDKAQENSNTKPAVVADTGDVTQTLLIAMVTVCGFFIRTSFVAFALVPLLLWMLKDEWSIPSLVAKAFQLGVFALAWILALVLVDTAYHNPSHLTKLTSLGSFDIQACFDWITKLTLTPLNNVLYNSNVENLSQHGIHPCYTHLLVNLPIMFGPLALLLLFLGFRALFRPQKIETIEMNNFYLAFSIISPLAILSMIPHQEPRFILPLVVPLVVVLAQCFKKMHEHKIFFSLWALFNMAAFFAFGVLHQGGVLPSIDYIHSVVELEESVHGRGSWQRSSVTNSCNLTFIYYHTYMPPRHLTDLSAISKSPARVRKCKVNVIDLAGSTPYLLFEKNIRTWLKNSQVFVVFPTSIPCEDIERLQTRFSARITFEYFPHFSGEDPPWKDNMLSCPKDDTTRPLGDYFDRLKLRSYRIEHAITFPVPMVKISPLPVAGESIVM